MGPLWDLITACSYADLIIGSFTTKLNLVLFIKNYGGADVTTFLTYGLNCQPNGKSLLTLLIRCIRPSNLLQSEGFTIQ